MATTKRLNMNSIKKSKATSSDCELPLLQSTYHNSRGNSNVIDTKDKVLPESNKPTDTKRDQRLRRLHYTCRDIKKENEHLKSELVKANEMIRNLSEKATDHEFQMKQLTKVLNKMRRKNTISTSKPQLESSMDSDLKLQLEDIEDDIECNDDTGCTDDTECNDAAMNIPVTPRQSSDSAESKDNPTTLDRLEKLILTLPVESLKQLEIFLKSSERQLTESLTSIERSRAKNAFYQSIKDELIFKTERLRDMKRKLLDTLYTVCPKCTNDSGITSHQVMHSASGRLSPVIEEKARGDDEYFRYPLVVPKLDLNMRLDNAAVRRAVKSSGSLSECLPNRSEQNRSTYLENKGEYFAFKGYNGTIQSRFEDIGKKDKKTFAKRVRTLALMFVNALGNKNKKSKAVANDMSCVDDSGNDVIPVMSDISVLSRNIESPIKGKDYSQPKSESFVPKLDFSDLESPKRDTSTVPLCISLSDNEDSPQNSPTQDNVHTDMVNQLKINIGKAHVEQKKKGILSRLRAMFKRKKNKK